MGASTVTGKGIGNAGLTRGPNNGRNQFFPMVDPHVVWHGTVEIVGDSPLVTVYLPSSIRVPPTHLAVFCSGMAYCIDKGVDGDGNMDSFTVYAAGDYADFIVVDANNACFCEDHFQGQ